MTEDHLSTERLLQAIASHLTGAWLDYLSEDSPRILVAEVVSSDTMGITVDSLPPLGQGETRRVEYRELRLSPVLLRDEPARGEDEHTVDEAESSEPEAVAS